MSPPSRGRRFKQTIQPLLRSTEAGSAARGLAMDQPRLGRGLGFLSNQKHLDSAARLIYFEIKSSRISFIIYAPRHCDTFAFAHAVRRLRCAARYAATKRETLLCQRLQRRVLLQRRKRGPLLRGCNYCAHGNAVCQLRHGAGRNIDGVVAIRSFVDTCRNAAERLYDAMLFCRDSNQALRTILSLPARSPSARACRSFSHLINQPKAFGKFTL